MKSKIRLITTVALSIAACAVLFVQIQKNENSSAINSEKSKVSFNSAKSVSKKISKNKKEVLQGHADKFAEMHREIRTRGDKQAPEYPLNYRNIEKENAIGRLKNKAVNKSKILSRSEIIERGPSNVSGRTRAIAVDPSDETQNTWFVGAVGGGIWKTTDAGASWENKTPDIPNLSISTLVIAPSNNNVMWAGTGEGFFNVDAIRGDGLIVSTDHGETWNQVESSLEFGCVNRLIVDPTNENVVLAAVSQNLYSTGGFGRIYKTMNGGETWDMVYSDNGNNRIQQIVHHPDSFHIQYASINSVGIIKSTDAGTSWSTVLSVNNVGRYELAIAPSNANVLYASIEASDAAYLYKSTDAGANWNDMSNGGSFPNWLGAQGWYDNTIAVNPYDENDVYVGGIHLWHLIQGAAGITSIEENNTHSFLDFLPWGGFNDSGIGLGISFTSANGLPAPLDLQASDYSSVEIRFGEGKTQKAYRFTFDGNNVFYQEYIDVPFEVWDIDNNQQLMVSFLDANENNVFDLWPMNNEMCEFVFINAVEYSTTENSNITGNNGIGFIYKNTFTVGPVLADGASWTPDDLPESELVIHYGTGGGNDYSLEQISNGYFPNGNAGTHADHHNLTMLKTNDADSSFRIINGNDGGVFYSDDFGITWTNTLNGYNTSQFYGIDKKHGADAYIGGMQDNGTWQSPSGGIDATTPWNHKIGGDGYETSWHYSDGDLIIGGYQFNGLMRSLNGGVTWTSLAGMIENGSGNAPFVTKVAKSNSDPDLIFAVGKSGVWRSDNFGSNWTLVPIPASQWGMTSLTQVEISYANPQIVWAGARMNDPSLPNAGLHVSTDGGVSFTKVNGSDFTLGRVTGLASHPTDDQSAFALFSFAGAPKILRTNDLGATWTDISGFGNEEKSNNGFPDVATYSLLVMPHNTDVIWAGTEIGLFESTDNGATWHYAIEEFPAVSIWQMNITDDQVVMATHGRGIITVTIPELPEPPVVTLAPRIESNGMDMFKGELEIKAKLRSLYDSTQLLVNDVYYSSIPGNSTITESVIIYNITDVETVTFQCVSFKDGQTYHSAIINETVFTLLESAYEYINPLNESTSDFIGNGFSIKSHNGFSENAIHSQHPCVSNSNFEYMLRVPIIIDDINPTMTFNEIAIMEPGEVGANWPADEFWDYVVVECSRNGKAWYALDDGYDASVHDNWLSAYNGMMSVDESLYHKRSIDLDGLFAVGDTILLRFRLFTDGAVDSWGWVIDSLEIQKNAVSISSNLANNLAIELSNYPNPSSNFTTISFYGIQEGTTQLEVFNIYGALVESKTLQVNNNLEQIFELNCSKYETGTYYYRVTNGMQSKTAKMMVVR